MPFTSAELGITHLTNRYALQPSNMDALPEEILSKCLGRSIYQATPSEVLVTESGKDEDDVKCSICQEEYVFGDEIGKFVKCQHGYHATCINQWLRLQNWCPICKALLAS
ncbi:RING/U-box superfamily protein [Abeliophyllum distichum]|uniref:RING-type E3 ubiquitin transferase n=1 Tax=Abeliophyllum distichum TaxID=126358 RepID=A0ABD1TXH4_9LAMI